MIRNFWLVLILVFIGSIIAFVVLKPRFDYQKSVTKLKQSIQAGDSVEAARLISVDKYLLTADLGSRRGDKMLPLLLAARLGQEAVCSNLLVLGADVNEEDKYHNTPLHCAVNSGNTNLIRMLLLHGVDPLRRDMNDRTPEDLAKLLGDTNALSALRPTEHAPSSTSQ